MRITESLVAVAAVIVATWARAQVPSRVEPSREVQSRTPRRADADVVGLFRYEPTGLSLLRPYRRGKIPMVLIHGLWSNPWSWARMVEELEADAALRDRYQFWTFGYSTGDPLPYSAALLRHDLNETRRKFDPARSDAAFDRMVLVGHSMGGLLAKMMVQDSGTRLWRLVSDRPVEDLAGDQADWPRPNIHDTKGKLEGRYFAEWGRGEEKDAESRGPARGTPSNRGRFRIARSKSEMPNSGTGSLTLPR
jgi:pimeloyl-ACP methyl ester carboxylesterase